MIKLDLPDKPANLTDELIAELTAKYMTDKEDVWNKPFLRKAVADISFNKCCYTELELDTESTYMEVDHFLPKKHFPNDVLTWGNLLPSCKKSNTTKGDLNTKLEPIVNPTVDDPKEHLKIIGFRFYPKTEIGRRTIEYTALNDRKHFVDKRYKIGVKIIEMLEGIYLDLIDLINNIEKNRRKITRLITKYRYLLEEADRREKYAATVSTTILTDVHNPEIMTILKGNDFWDNELEVLIEELNFCCLI